MQVGDRVIFRGREHEMGKYHPDLAQLLGRTGVVVQSDPRLEMVDVQFEGVCWHPEEINSPIDVFPVFRNEVELVK